MKAKASEIVQEVSKCNLKCPYCYHGDKLKGRNYSISKDVYFDIINQLVEKGGDYIEISGGEPLLHPQIDDFIKIAKDKGLRVKLITNGTLISKMNIEIVSLVDELAISIDGSNAYEHDKIRGKDSFELICAGIKKLEQYNLRNKVTYNITVSHRNIDKVKEYIDFAMSCKISRINFNELHKTYNRYTDYFKDELLSEDETEKLREILLIYKDKYKEKLTIIPSRETGGDCPLLHDGENALIRINYNGDVFICEGFCCDDFSIGNINHNNLTDIMQGNECKSLIAFVRDRVNLISECKTCVLKSVGYCKGGCIADAYYRQRDCICTDGWCKIRLKKFYRQMSLMKKKERYDLL